MKRFGAFAAVALGAIALLAVGAGPAAAERPVHWGNSVQSAVLSGGFGPASQPTIGAGIGITECPQARLDKYFPQPPDRRQKDRVEIYSDGGDDRRTNEEFSCFPQNETSIDTNPVIPKNLVAGANDYRLGWGSSGFYASNDNGQKWYGGIIPFPTLPSGDNLDGGGDPAIAFDRAGVVYYADINFNRTDDTNGIFVTRSTNGGFTWSRPCVAIRSATAPDRCGGFGDPRKPGDGVVSFQEDTPERMANFSVPFNDKEYIAVGPRPLNLTTAAPNDRIDPVCFPPNPRRATDPPTVPCDPATVGVDRIYVTWTKFEVIATALLLNANVYFSYSDDQGRSWSPEKAISGTSTRNCRVSVGLFECDANQFSVPTAHPTTGFLYVAFENFNTTDENQYLLVRSHDGGSTFQGPFFVTPIFDVNFPLAGDERPDCTDRGQQGGRIVYSNSCFRSNAAGNVFVDPRPHQGPGCPSSDTMCDLGFADDLYLVMADNRNGTPGKTNSDVFFFKSTDGGQTWLGPTRVNNDPSELTGDRDDPDNINVVGNDQWWPWIETNLKGHLNVIFHDRRLDRDSMAHEYPGSRQHPGNYLVWTWGGQCTITSTARVTGTGNPNQPIPAAARECLAPLATVIVPPDDLSVFNPGPGPQPGQAPGFLGPFRNFGVSDFPSNFDYSFRGGIFAGDYNNVAVTPNDTKTYAHWTDARNGRSSGNTRTGTAQPGRNPACEQADVMVDEYASESPAGGQEASKPEDKMFLVTPCPPGMADPGNQSN